MTVRIKVDRRLAPRLFDPAEPLVALRPLSLTGDDRLAPGDPVPDGVLNDGQKLRLWMCAHVVYAKDWHPTPVEGDIDPATVVVDPDEVEKAVEELEATSEPQVTITPSGIGRYIVTPSWDENLAEKVLGKAAAEELRDQMLAHAPVAKSPQPESAQDAPEPVSQPEAQPDAASQPEEQPEAAGDTSKE